jgi:hypothetical protein
VIREATANMAVTSPELLADNLDADDAAGQRARQAAAERIQRAKRPEFHSLDFVLGARIDGSPVIAGGPGAGATAAARLAQPRPVAVRRTRRRVHAAGTAGGA